jgi:hypothetical protein
METRFVSRRLFPLILTLLLLELPGVPAVAQSLSWEGQTGAVFSPTAYLGDSPAEGFGRPVGAFHLLDAGEVLGTHFQTSLTVGYRNRLEFGITRSSVASVGDEGAASLFDRGFTAIHAKLGIWKETEAGPASPSISLGGILRWQGEHIGADVIPSDPTQNGDVYIVATKTLILSTDVSLLLSGGGRATKAVLFGIGGNTPSWELRAFASGGVILLDRLVLGAEFVQQPAHLDGFPRASMPSTTTVFARGYPLASGRLSLDLALVRVAGAITSRLDLKAEKQLLAGGSFRF